GSTGVGGSGGRVVTASGGSGNPVGPDAGAADRICQQAELDWVPKIPTVYLLVDRSGSMFDCSSTTNAVEPSCPTPSDTPWTKLKDATLAVVNSLQTEVRFGFASFTGTNPASGGTCPIIDKVAPSLGNGAAIATLYNGLAFQPNTTEQGKKFETPARQALDMIGAALLADTAPGEKYILFVTDGQPDYCDDANSLCAPDSVIGGLQALKAKGVTTIVIGLQSAINDLPPGILQAFANAGAGEPTLAPLRAGADTFAFFDQCNSIAGWHADLVTSAKPQVRGTTLGMYDTTAGPTKPYTPDASNQTMLMNQLSQALSGVKSCTFDLGDINGKSIKVDLTQLDQASITVMGTALPRSDTNGWRMNSATQLELTGGACATWRMPNTTTIRFGFPCEIIIIE
ncbi:MAG: VWA domain-containing protein, partial [Deltaproteobacteria bacterium]|nr:VWA domain-containing protein [Deltaproteobacteria bacterium]